MAGLTQQQINYLSSLKPHLFGNVGEVVDISQGILLALITISEQLAQANPPTSSGIQPLPQPEQPSSQTPTSPFQSVNLTISEGVNKNSSFGNFTAPFDGVAVLSVALSGGGVLSMVAQKPSGRSTSPVQLFGGTKLQAGQQYDIPIGITSDNKYYFQSDTTGTASWQVVSYDVPVVLSPFAISTPGGGGVTGVVATDILLSTTSPTTILTYTTGTSAEPLEAALDLNIITGSTAVTAVLSWVDPNNGPGTFYWENGGSVPVGPHGYDIYPFTASANSNVTVTVTAGSTSRVYVTSSIEKQV